MIFTIVRIYRYSNSHPNIQEIFLYYSRTNYNKYFKYLNKTHNNTDNNADNNVDTNNKKL